jgi:hypothetical protein
MGLAHIIVGGDVDSIVDLPRNARGRLLPGHVGLGKRDCVKALAIAGDVQIIVGGSHLHVAGTTGMRQIERHAQAEGLLLPARRQWVAAVFEKLPLGFEEIHHTFFEDLYLRIKASIPVDSPPLHCSFG